MSAPADSMSAALRAAIMDLAVDDYTGLWELAWRASTLFPDATDEARRVAADETRRLAEEGWLAAFATDDDGANPRELERAAALAALEDPEAWNAAGKGAQLRVAATEAGERAYEEGRFSSD